jgi:hypothetical protein
LNHFFTTLSTLALAAMLSAAATAPFRTSPMPDFTQGDKTANETHSGCLDATRVLGIINVSPQTVTTRHSAWNKGGVDSIGMLNLAQGENWQ